MKKLKHVLVTLLVIGWIGGWFIFAAGDEIIVTIEKSQTVLLYE